MATRSMRRIPALSSRGALPAKRNISLASFKIPKVTNEPNVSSPTRMTTVALQMKLTRSSIIMPKALPSGLGS